MKKKLEAELISIAHRILKLKNRAELDQLQQETLKLYEKISVLRFVEDNFSDVKPTIGYASAEETLEEIYGIEETTVVHANEQEAKEDEAREEKKAKAAESKVDGQKSRDDDQDNTQPETDKPEGDADPEQPVDEYQASEEEKEHTEENTDEEVEEEEPEADEPQATSQEPQEDETRNAQPVRNEPETVSAQPEIEKPAEDVKAMEAGAEAVYKKEDKSTEEEEEQAIDAEVITIAPDDKAKVEDFGVNFEFAFERTSAPEEPQKQKEITFEDYRDYKEPEFVKKGDEAKAEEPQATSQQPKVEEQPQATSRPPQAEEKPKEETRDWRDWEPAKDEDKPQANSQQPPAVSQDPKPKTQNPAGNSRALTLGLNDRIAFEKNLFGGSGEDLNRVVSQLNTFDSFDEAKEFIADMVKPDYNNWQGKEEYEERFMALVEKKFD